MPKFDLDKLFDYLIVIAIVVGPVLAAVVKKLIAVFSPKPPESQKPPAPSRADGRKARQPTARPVAPIELPGAPAVRVLRPEPPPVAQPAPIARRVALGDPSATDAARPSRSTGGVPMTLEATVEDHLGHLTSSVELEAGHTARDVRRRLKHVEAHVGSLQQKQDRGSERKTVAGAATDSTSVRRLTRRGLRRAILLREILGPPIALRAPDESC